jgi:hypothetical protein
MFHWWSGHRSGGNIAQVKNGFYRETQSPHRTGGVFSDSLICWKQEEGFEDGGYYIGVSQICLRPKLAFGMPLTVFSRLVGTTNWGLSLVKRNFHGSLYRSNYCPRNACTTAIQAGAPKAGIGRIEETPIQ